MSYLIFAVEDNPIAGEIVQTALESRGHSVALVSTGRHAIEWLSNNRCDLILLDLMLPDADGGQLVEVLRRLPNGADIPILGTLFRSDLFLRRETERWGKAAAAGAVSR